MCGEVVSNAIEHFIPTVTQVQSVQGFSFLFRLQPFHFLLGKKKLTFGNFPVVSANRSSVVCTVSTLTTATVFHMIPSDCDLVFWFYESYHLSVVSPPAAGARRGLQVRGRASARGER